MTPWRRSSSSRRAEHALGIAEIRAFDLDDLRPLRRARPPCGEQQFPDRFGVGFQQARWAVWRACRVSTDTALIIPFLAVARGARLNAMTRSRISSSKCVAVYPTTPPPCPDRARGGACLRSPRRRLLHTGSARSANRCARRSLHATGGDRGRRSPLCCRG